jgi:hypothetical protein
VSRTKPEEPLAKANGLDTVGRFREIIMDPLNLAIRRHPDAGLIDGQTVVLHNGNRAGIVGQHAYYGSFSAILAINRGVHEPLQEYVFQQMIKRLGPHPVMIELGAYWAHYSMWLKGERPGAHTFLVEPVSEYLEVGRRNFTINGYEGDFIKAFVGRDAWALDTFSKAKHLAHVDVLLADIEGFEVEMLEGAKATLANKMVDYLFISTHSQDLHNSVVSMLEAHAYQIEVSSDYAHHTTSCDGLVVATSPDAALILSGFVPLGREDIARKTPAELADYLYNVVRAGV